MVFRMVPSSTRLSTFVGMLLFITRVYRTAYTNENMTSWWGRRHSGAIINLSPPPPENECGLYNACIIK